jgi:N-formylglutamate deformylase
VPRIEFPDPGTTFHRRVVIPPEMPVVLSVPHAGTATTGFEDALAPTLEVRGDADLFVHRLYGVDLEPGSESKSAESRENRRAPLVYVAARLSRFVCDMNRHPDDVSPSVVPDHPAPLNSDGRGFVWAVTTTGAPALAHPLTLAEWRARQAVHAAYHAAIAEALARARNRFGFALLVDGHSMPSVGRAGHKDPGRPRADVVPGDRDGTSCSPALSRLVEQHFKSDGYSVSLNDPYKGGFITTHHGKPAEDVHAIQIEVRRDLYMDEPTFTLRPEGLARLQETLASLMAALAHWKP